MIFHSNVFLLSRCNSSLKKHEYVNCVIASGHIQVSNRDINELDGKQLTFECHLVCPFKERDTVLLIKTVDMRCFALSLSEGKKRKYAYTRVCYLDRLSHSIIE